MAMPTAGSDPLPRPDELERQAQATVLKRLRAMLQECDRLMASLYAEERARPPAKVLAKLKDRDIEFIHLVCHRDNWPYPYIAQLMKVELPTLHRIRQKVFAALGVSCRIDLVRRVQGWT